MTCTLRESGTLGLFSPSPPFLCAQITALITSHAQKHLDLFRCTFHASCPSNSEGSVLRSCPLLSCEFRCLPKPRVSLRLIPTDLFPPNARLLKPPRRPFRRHRRCGAPLPTRDGNTISMELPRGLMFSSAVHVHLWSHIRRLAAFHFADEFPFVDGPGAVGRCLICLIKYDFSSLNWSSSCLSDKKFGKKSNRRCRFMIRSRRTSGDLLGLAANI